MTTIYTNISHTVSRSLCSIHPCNIVSVTKWIYSYDVKRGLDLQF